MPAMPKKHRDMGCAYHYSRFIKALQDSNNKNIYLSGTGEPYIHNNITQIVNIWIWISCFLK